MEQLGVLAEALGETQDGVEADLTPARRRTGAGAIGEVLGAGDPFLRGGTQAQERGVGARGEVLAAGSTAQAAEALPPARPAMQAQVALAVPVHVIMFIRPLNCHRRAPRTRPTLRRWFLTGPRLP